MSDTEFPLSESDISFNPNKPVPSPHKYETLPGGHIKKRPHRHSRGEIPSEDKDYFKSLKEREVDDRRMVRQQIDEALQDFELDEEAVEEYSPQFFDDWDYDEILRAEYRLEEQGIEVLPSSSDILDTSDADLENNESHEEKVARYELHKDKLATKQKYISQLMETITTVVYGVPDIRSDELMELVEKFREDAELTPDEIGIFRSIAESYQKKHDTVVEYHESLSVEEIYSACFGKPPSGHVESEIGPMTILIRCYDPHDYAHAYYFNSQKANQLTESDIKHASSSDGLAFRSVVDPRLHGVVIMENATRGLLPLFRRMEIRDHEEQHQINKLFSPMEQKMSDDWI